MFDSILAIINKVIPDKDAAKKAAVELDKEITKQMELKASIIEEEIKQGGITSKWRPYTMILFIVMVFTHWFMYDVIPFIRTTFDFNFYVPQDPGFTEGLLDLIQIGLMGYIGGRSAEKMIGTWKNK